jgi:hypothetical protein
MSGVVREAFITAGCDAISCDILPSEIPGPHIQGDVLEVLKSRHWDAAICFPPCTYLCNSGVRWLYKQGTREPVTERWQAMREGAAFFAALWNAPVARLCLENPVMHGHARAELGKYGVPGSACSLQPFEHGHGETKRTCLWLRGLPALVPSNTVPGRTPRVHHASPGPDRWKERSRTLPGVGRAMASQWSPLLFP